jgi:hypothetical protein
LLKRVATFVVAGLALWDPEVVLRFSQARIEDILDPARILFQLGKERDWLNHTDSARKNAWHTGCSDVFEGRERAHSALLACCAAQEEIRRRVWNAEVGVMLPYVEEQRQDILVQLTGYLHVPFKTRFGDVIDDVRDLEIGHIEAQLKSSGTSLNPGLMRSIQRLRNIRNRLSHLETLPLELLAE